MVPVALRFPEPRRRGERAVAAETGRQVARETMRAVDVETEGTVTNPRTPPTQQGATAVMAATAGSAGPRGWRTLPVAAAMAVTAQRVPLANPGEAEVLAERGVTAGPELPITAGGAAMEEKGPRAVTEPAVTRREEMVESTETAAMVGSLEARAARRWASRRRIRAGWAARRGSMVPPGIPV